MLVSIIIPCFNNATTLERAIESAISQNHLSSKEIIIVDNNSTDSSLSIANKYAKRSASFVSVYQEKRQGSYFARNTGLEKSSGEWIQFLDADDVILPDKISNQINEASLDHDLVVSPFIEIDFKGQKHISKINNNNWLGLIKGSLGVTSSHLWKREMLLQLNGWSLKVQAHQDYELLFRFLKRSDKILHLDRYDTIKYETQQSISLQNSFPRIGILLRNDIENFLRESRLLDDELYNALQQYYFDKLHWMAKVDSSELDRILRKISLEPKYLNSWRKYIIKILGQRNYFLLYNSLFH